MSDRIQGRQLNRRGVGSSHGFGRRNGQGGSAADACYAPLMAGLAFAVSLVFCFLIMLHPADAAHADSMPTVEEYSGVFSVTAPTSINCGMLSNGNLVTPSTSSFRITNTGDTGVRVLKWETDSANGLKGADYYEKVEGKGTWYLDAITTNAHRRFARTLSVDLLDNNEDDQWGITPGVGIDQTIDTSWNINSHSSIGLSTWGWVDPELWTAPAEGDETNLELATITWTFISEYYPVTFKTHWGNLGASFEDEETGETGTQVTYIVESGTKLDEPGEEATDTSPAAPTYAGHKLRGWRAKGKNQSRSYTWDFDSDVVTQPLTLTALWEDDPEEGGATEYHKVTFHAAWDLGDYSNALFNDGQRTRTITVPHGELVDPPSDPYVNGNYEFDAWATRVSDESGSTYTRFDFENTPITKDIELWSLWTERDRGIHPVDGTGVYLCYAQEESQEGAGDGETLTIVQRDEDYAVWEAAHRDQLDQTAWVHFYTEEELANLGYFDLFEDDYPIVHDPRERYGSEDYYDDAKAYSPHGALGFATFNDVPIFKISIDAFNENYFVDAEAGLYFYDSYFEYSDNNMFNYYIATVDVAGPVKLKSTRCWFLCLAVFHDIKYKNLKNLDSTDYTAMFSSNDALVSEPDFRDIDTSKVTSMVWMFNRCASLTSLDLSSFNTSSVTDMYGMFRYCEEGLTSLDLSSFNTSNVENMAAMFKHCHALKSINVSSFNTSNVTNMESMFYWDYELESLDVSKFDTSKVIYMNAMFEELLKVKYLDVTSFNTSNVVDMYHMFYECTSLKSLDLSNFNTGNVTDMGSMFAFLRSVEKLDVSNFNCDKVEYFDEMFYVCQALTEIVHAAGNGLHGKTYEKMFENCESLQEINLPYLYVDKVDTSSGLNRMFADCTELKKINVLPGTDWSRDSSAGGFRMFWGCNKLVGENGTTYSDSYASSTRACIDGLNGKNGYFSSYGGGSNSLSPTSTQSTSSSSSDYSSYRAAQAPSLTSVASGQSLENSNEHAASGSGSYGQVKALSLTSAISSQSQSFESLDDLAALETRVVSYSVPG